MPGDLLKDVKQVIPVGRYVFAAGDDEVGAAGGLGDRLHQVGIRIGSQADGDDREARFGGQPVLRQGGPRGIRFGTAGLTVRKEDDTPQGRRSAAFNQFVSGLLQAAGDVGIAVVIAGVQTAGSCLNQVKVARQGLL